MEGVLSSGKESLSPEGKMQSGVVARPLKSRALVQRKTKSKNGAHRYVLTGVAFIKAFTCLRLSNEVEALGKVQKRSGRKRWWTCDSLSSLTTHQGVEKTMGTTYGVYDYGDNTIRLP